MSGHKQSHLDLERHLNEQLDFMCRSARAFDEGEIAEAKRLAVAIRILVHDSKKSTSLLKQLNRKEGTFPDTSRERAPSSASLLTPAHYRLIELASQGYRAPLDGALIKRIPFRPWWEDAVFESQAGATFSREDIVLSIADQDGGAHVDPTLNEKYAKFERANLLGHHVGTWTGGPPVVGQQLPVENLMPLRHACLVAVRQIAHELLIKFIPGYLTWSRPNPSGPTVGEVSVGLA